MSALNTKHEAQKVGDVYHIDPRDITLQEEDLRGRKFPPSKTDVKELAESIMRHGQEEAVKCRLGEDGKPILVFGRTRFEAVMLINTELDPKNPRKIVARIVTQDEKSAFLSANEENKRRKATTPVDEAFNHQVMRERFQMKDADIAKDCGVSAAWVSKLRKITSLPKEVLKQVHDGNITVSDAVNMADLEAEEAKKIAAKAEETNKQASAAAAKEAHASGKKVAATKASKRPSKEAAAETKAAVRSAKAKKAAKSGEEVGGVSSRSVREIHAFYETLAETYANSEPITEFSKSMAKYCSGKISDKQLENAVMKLAQSGLKSAPQKAALVDWE